MTRQLKSLAEDMSFRQLMNYSDPKRVVRSLTVHGPPLNIRAFEDSMYYLFNFKSSPSTTGLRHKGYIKFQKPRRKKALMDVNCVVDCTCQDFRYRFAWADKQRRASRVGPDSMNQAINRPPRITNPTGRPGLCKHLLALRNWIDNSIDMVTSDTEDDGSALKRLVAYAQHRHANEPEIMATAKSKDYNRLLSLLRKRKGEPGAIDKVSGKSPDSEGPDDGLIKPVGPVDPSVDIAPESPEAEPPIVSPIGSKNPLDFHGRVNLTHRDQGPDKKPTPGKTKPRGRPTVDSLENTTLMNLIEAQKTLAEMIDASPAAASIVSPTGPTSPGLDGTGNTAGEVTPESEALELLRSVSSGIQTLVQTVQGLADTGIQGPGSMDGIDFPEPEGGGDDLDVPPEAEGGEDRFNTGGEDSSGEFGDLTGGPDEFKDEEDEDDSEDFESPNPKRLGKKGRNPFVAGQED